MTTKKRPGGTVPCEARVIPMQEKGMRACGLTPTVLFQDRHLCQRHVAIARRRAGVPGSRRTP